MSPAAKPQPSLDLVDILARIRRRLITVAASGWPELGALAETIFPQPLSPFALLPIATGQAVGALLEPLVNAAAAMLLIEQALRIVDDCADGNDGGLHTALGVGRAMNLALTFQSLGTRELAALALPPRRRALFMDDAFRSLIEICQGQDQDMCKSARSLEEYQLVVEHKSVAAYEWMALVGAMVGTDNAELLDRCARCGCELAWMAQILNDIGTLRVSTTAVIRGENRWQPERLPSRAPPSTSPPPASQNARRRDGLPISHSRLRRQKRNRVVRPLSPCLCC